MEELNSEVAETTSTEAVETGPVDIAAPKEEGLEVGNAEEAVTPADPEYVPNLKFKAFDEEKEFDEWVKPLIKSKEEEEKFRDLYSRAHGIERYKSDFHTTKQEVTNLKQGIESLKEHLRNDDFDSFFQETNIPMDKVWNWVKQKLAYSELSPEEKQRYDETWRLKRERSQLSKTNQTVTSQFQEAQVRQKQLELDYVCSTPDVSQAMKSFDERIGKSGAFVDFVIQKGLAKEQLTGRECSVQEAVQEVMSLIKAFGGNQVAQAAAANANGVVAAKGTKPLLPNIQGKAVSPVKKKPGSFKELRAQVESRLAAKNS